MLTLPLLSIGCGGSSAAREQWLVVVDTNLPSVSQAVADPGVSLAATVDTLRVDVIRADGSLDSLREVVVVDEHDWPVSFGVVIAQSDSVLLRLRAFYSGLSVTGEALGQTVLEPLPSTAVDRLVELRRPSDGVRTAHVWLEGDCLGMPVSFAPRSTGIDRDQAAAEAREAWSENAPVATHGNWPDARAVDCAVSGPEGSTCVAGGFTVLGSLEDRGLVDGTLVFDDSLPPRPVVVGPFHLDSTEVTVGRLRKLLSDQPTAVSDLPRPQGSGSDAFCTWLGPSDPSHDDRPVNCMTYAVAESVCTALGGRLPSEAEWEHAARGRGQQRRYPWGDAAPSCCTLVAGGVDCGYFEVAPVGEAAKQTCQETDRSRDGVLDLAGNVAELTRDAYASFSEPCWAVPGVRRDPSCQDSGTGTVTLRGGNLLLTPSLALATLRRPFPRVGEFVGAGFRCAYPAGGTP